MKTFRKKSVAKQQQQSTKGITLIALIITIIVLLILAGVSLNMVFNSNGLFSRTNKTAKEYNKTKAKETLEIAFSDLQIEKYERGLTKEELDARITEEISKMHGEEIGDDKTEVIVDGYRFEVDRTIPKIIDVLGKTDGVVISASVSGNEGWIKQGEKVNVTGVVKTYSGGKITKATITRDGTTTDLTLQPDGKYTINDITETTEITINAQDSNNKTNTKHKKVEVKVDGEKPVIEEINPVLTDDGLTIELEATATDEPSGVDYLHYTIEPTNGVTPTEGNFKAGEKPKIKTTTETTYTIKVKAIDKAGNESEEKTKTIATKKYTISLNRSQVTVTGGKSYTHNVKVEATTDGPGVEWSIENKNIATVDQTGTVLPGQTGGDTKLIAKVKGTNIQTTCIVTTEIFSEIKGDNTNYKDKNGDIATIPKGFAVGTSDNVNTIGSGLTIQDNTGNQFVWIPCYLEGGVRTSTTYATEYKRTDFGKYYDTNTNFSYFSENLNDTDANSIKAYGGFYIGRYEVGKVGTDTAVIKKNEVPYNNINMTNIQTKSNNFASNNNYEASKVYTKLVSSYAWDTALNFIQKTVSNYAIYSPYDNFKDSIYGYGLLNTGLTTSVCNIYDMGGNLCEYTSGNIYGHEGYVVRGESFEQIISSGHAGNRTYYNGNEIIYNRI